MNTFMTIIFSVLFLGIPAYYFGILFSTYNKQVRKNKQNIKLVMKINTISVYLADIVLVIATLIFAIYSYFNNSYAILIVPMIFIDIVVFILIKVSSSNFYIFNDYMIVKNFYVSFNERQNVLLKPEKSANIYELSISTKDYLHTCSLKVDDPKSLIKQIKSLLPKNIKIKEVPAK